jgi:hypothetical protein
VLWVVREHLGPRSSQVLRWLAFAAALAILVWVLFESGAIIGSAKKTVGLTAPGTPPLIAAIFEIFQLKFAGVFGLALAIGSILALRLARTAIPIFSTCFVFLIFLLPSGFWESRGFGAPASIAEFSDWQRVIPPDSTVLVVPSRDVGSFVWFTLQRPNYLTMDQSAGVVFSRATALEVRRRSESLRSVTDPDWKIMSRLREYAASNRKVEVVQRPLTANGLAQICQDPKLGFVVSQKNVGFSPLSHQQDGAWKDWNLYACRQVSQEAQ